MISIETVVYGVVGLEICLIVIWIMLEKWFQENEKE
jgi:hypothetical protein